MAESKTYSVKNTAPGIRGLNAVTGYTELAPGETREGVELTAAEFKSARSTGYFDFGDAPEPEETTDDLDTTVAKLRDIAKAENVDLGTVTAKADIQAAIRAARDAKANPAPAADDLDAMSDEDLRATVQAITGEAPAADADRATLLALARGQ